jgi:hypothetical protein
MTINKIQKESTELEISWFEYLNSSVSKGLYLKKQVNEAISLVKKLKVIPTTNPGDSDSLQLSWDDGQKYIEIEILRNLYFHWFFSNRDDSEENMISSESEIEVPGKFFELFNTLNHKNKL